MSNKQNNIASITAVILAGGQARRMGGQDKGLVKVAGKAMIEYAIEAIQPQVGTLLINANRNLEYYAKYGFPVIEDSVPDFSGPLAGMASALKETKTDYLLSLPCDSPYVPDDLAERLFTHITKEDAEISVAHNGERLQPVFCLMKTHLLDSILNYLEAGERKIDRWFAKHKMVTADFSDKPETFINVNDPADIENLEAGLASTTH